MISAKSDLPGYRRQTSLKFDITPVLFFSTGVINVQDKLTPEYIFLFQATTKTIESLQERLSLYAALETDGIIAYLQKLQLFLIEAQQKAEDIFLDRTE